MCPHRASFLPTHGARAGGGDPVSRTDINAEQVLSNQISLPHDQSNRPRIFEQEAERLSGFPTGESLAPELRRKTRLASSNSPSGQALYTDGCSSLGP